MNFRFTLDLLNIDLLDQSYAHLDMLYTYKLYTYRCPQ